MGFIPTPCGDATRGDVLFPRKENIPPYTPQEKGTRGLPPRPRTLAVSILKSCSACGIGCGVHGFAMNPCISLLLSTAPYYREARVTFAWRRTACGMRHCCARRIVETGGRRELLRTSTRWAERHPQGVCRIRKASEPPTAAQQRIVGANQIVSQHPTRQRRAQGSAIGKRRISSSCSLAMAGSRGRAPCVLLGDLKGAILFCEREWPPFITPWCGRTKRPHDGSARYRWRTLSHSAYPGARCG